MTNVKVISGKKKKEIRVRPLFNKTENGIVSDVYDNFTRSLKKIKILCL